MKKICDVIIDKATYHQHQLIELSVTRHIKVAVMRVSNRLSYPSINKCLLNEKSITNNRYSKNVIFKSLCNDIRKTIYTYKIT